MKWGEDREREIGPCCPLVYLPKAHNSQNRERARLPVSMWVGRTGPAYHHCCLPSLHWQEGGVVGIWTSTPAAGLSSCLVDISACEGGFCDFVWAGMAEGRKRSPASFTSSIVEQWHAPSPGSRSLRWQPLHVLVLGRWLGHSLGVRLPLTALVDDQ